MKIRMHHTRTSFGLVFITVLLDMLAFGVLIPILPILIVDMAAGNTALGAVIVGVFGMAWALMQFLCSPIQGILSDRYGRRPVILASNLGLGLSNMIMALAPNLLILGLGRIISGIMGSSLTVAYAYIADITPKELRPSRFGMIGVAFSIGLVLGPAIGGLASHAHPRLPFWIAAAVSGSNALYGYFFLPESLAQKWRTNFTWRKANPVSSLKLLRIHPELTGLACVNFLGELGHTSLLSVAVLYLQYRYHWSNSTIGLGLSFLGLCIITAQGGIIGILVKRTGERTALAIGLVFGTAGLTALALAPSTPAVWISLLLIGFWGLAPPASLALMSRRLSPSQQGQLQGANSSLEGIANLIGPLLFTQVFALFIATPGLSSWPGAPFLLAALLVLISQIIVWLMPDNA